MKAMFETMKEIEIVEPMVSITSTLDEKSEAQMDELVAAMK